jgi:hypothetical protein
MAQQQQIAFGILHGNGSLIVCINIHWFAEGRLVKLLN